MIDIFFIVYKKKHVLKPGQFFPVTPMLEDSQEIKQNWTTPENFDIYLCLGFNCFQQSLDFNTEVLTLRKTEL